MKRVISLKEFSTTPTVSCMLRKDGNNVSANTGGAAGGDAGPAANAHAGAKPQPAEAPKAAPKQEDLFEME